MSQRYTEEQYLLLAQYIFDLYVDNYNENRSLLYATSPVANKRRIHEFAETNRINKGTSENYAERLFNKFNELNGFEIRNGLDGCPNSLAEKAQIVFDESRFNVRPLPSESDSHDDLSKRISESERLSDSELEARLRGANKKPKSVTVSSRQFVRSSDVIVFVLRRANGICEMCKQPAPFIRKKDKTPYLEVHHLERLADDGDDTAENAIAVCPNCHRKLHYGIND